jgi:hypothetical protein
MRASRVACIAIVALGVGLFVARATSSNCDDASGGGMHRIAYDYSVPIRALLPLRLAEFAGLPIVASAFLYPSNRPEKGLMLCRGPKGEFRLFVFAAKRNISIGMSAEGVSDIVCKRDLDICQIALDNRDAQALIQRWQQGIKLMREGDVGLEMDYLEIGLRSSVTPGLGRGFDRYGQYISDTMSDGLLSAIRLILSTDLRSKVQVEERLMSSLRGVLDEGK